MSYLSIDIRQSGANGELENAPWNVSLGSRNRLPQSMFDDKSLVIRGPVLVQVVDLEDVSLSRMARLDGMDTSDEANSDRVSASRRSGGPARRRVNYNVDDDEDGRSAPAGPAGGLTRKKLHKLVVEDTAGTRVFSIEYASVPGLGDVQLGAKLLLTSVPARRGVLLLDATNTTVLGGGIPAWNEDREENTAEHLRQQLQELGSSN